MRMPMSQRKDLIGHRFGNLVVREWVPRERGGAWRCACDCGGEHIATSNHLTAGRIISCGCVRPKHGGKGTRGYNVWRSMLGRCTQQNNQDWKDYGVRGISICQRWLKYPDFIADMGQPPAGGTIERRDNDGNYEPGNCFWASRKTQARNTRRSIVIEYRGRSQTLAAWAEEFGVNYWKLHSRYKLGWTSERMFADLLR